MYFGTPPTLRLSHRPHPRDNTARLYRRGRVQDGL